jgi:NAD(P)-dependent dehydrogenase (short-subunit alcohol dehydrogenase family)
VVASDISLDGRRVLIVGASKGVGRATAQALTREGAVVALAARSRDRLAAVAAECEGPGRAIPLWCDVTDSESCERVVDDAVRGLGGLEALVYCVGTSPYVALRDTKPAQWAEVLATNVIGTSTIIAAAQPHLERAKGHALFVSSVSTLSNPPWRGMGCYFVSKSALERLVQCWQAECPDVFFTSVLAGVTASEFPQPTAEEVERLVELFGEQWMATSDYNVEPVQPATHAEAIVHILGMRARVDVMAIREPSAFGMKHLWP